MNENMGEIASILGRGERGIASFLIHFCTGILEEFSTVAILITKTKFAKLFVHIGRSEKGNCRFQLRSDLPNPRSATTPT